MFQNKFRAMPLLSLVIDHGLVLGHHIHSFKRIFYLNLSQSEIIYLIEQCVFGAPEIHGIHDKRLQSNISNV